jgi:lactoylglutathione lyase
MQITQPGIILFTDHYEACVQFYRDICHLPEMFSGDNLTCLHFGGAYLMVEPGGVSATREKGRDRNPAVIRFNVPDVDVAADYLRASGVTVEVKHHDWGTIGIFHDPDGNRCELKDAWEVPEDAT